jgi:hypothetical protein
MAKRAARAYIIQLMAGRDAAEICCGDGGEFIGDSDDVRQIEDLIRYYVVDLSGDGICRPDGDLKRLDRLRKATHHLCARHRDKIERVASALLKQGKLHAVAIDRLVRPL